MRGPVLILFVGVLALACSASPPQTPVTDLVDPGPSAFAARHDHIQAYVGRCMADQEFEYEAEPAQPLPAESSDTRSIDYREEWGLASGWGLLNTTNYGVRSTNTDNLVSLNPQEFEQWAAAESSCLSEAGATTSVELPEHIAEEALQVQTWQHPDLADGLNKWRRCMTAAGYESSNPSELESLATDLYDESRTTSHPDDIAMALADRE